MLCYSEGGIVIVISENFAVGTSKLSREYAFVEVFIVILDADAKLSINYFLSIWYKV